MNRRLSTALPRPVFAILIIALVAAMAPALGTAGEITIKVIVTPTTLNLASGGSVVTAQTDIPYRDVEASSIYLNGVALDWWKVNNRGYFVAKFDMDDVKHVEGLNIDEYNTLTLVGVTKNGNTFMGSAEVMVTDRGK